MKDTCLTFDQMYDLLSCEELTPENKAVFDSYNSHMLACEACRHEYALLCDLNETLNGWTLKKHSDIIKRMEYLRSELEAMKSTDNQRNEQQ